MAIEERFFLANGMPAVYREPNTMALVAGGGELPNNAARDILAFISDRLAGTGMNNAEADKRLITAMYELAALCLAEPKIVLPRHNRVAGAGELSYTELSYAEVASICARFRYGIPLALSAAGDTGSGMGTTGASDGDAVPQGAV